MDVDDPFERFDWGRRSRRERGAESAYVISAAVGVALLAASILSIG